MWRSGKGVCPSVHYREVPPETPETLSSQRLEVNTALLAKEVSENLVNHLSRRQRQRPRRNVTNPLVFKTNIYILSSWYDSTHRVQTAMWYQLFTPICHRNAAIDIKTFLSFVLRRRFAITILKNTAVYMKIRPPSLKYRKGRVVNGQWSID